MKFSYFPGCTLKNKAQDLDRYARSSAEVLGIEMEELENWQCCGAVYPMTQDEIATKLSAVRALAAARDKQQDLLTLCSACHQVIKLVNHDMQSNEDIHMRANNYLQLDTPYNGETKVVHFLEMLRDTVGFDELKKKVVKPFTGKKIAAFYGCMLLRPSSVMQFDNPENPEILENFIRAIGAEPVLYPYRNECCGGYVTLEDKALAKKRAEIATESAKENGADMMVTACPLCRYNLTKNTDGTLPVFYFTELLAEALGVKE